MKTNVQILNEISAKLGGKADASVKVEALNNIANALGDNEPDRMVTISEALSDILEYVGGGGGGDITPVLKMEVSNLSNDAKEFGINAIQNHTVIYEDVSVPINSVQDVETLCVGEKGDDDEFIYYFNIELASSVTDLVNCTYDDETGDIYITDPSQNASCSVTYN